MQWKDGKSHRPYSMGVRASGSSERGHVPQRQQGPSTPPPQGSMAHMQKVRDSWIQPLGGPPTPSIYNATPYATHLAQWIKRETREYRLFTIADWFLWALWKNRRCDLERKKLRPNRYLQILKKDDDNNNNKRWQGRMSRFVVSLDDKTRTNRW